jgi:hypothetical protein
VCIASLRAHARESFAVQPINSRLLGSIYYRPEKRHGDGTRWDVISNAPMATEFSIARFFVHHLQRNGWALYCDCDFLFRAPVEELFALADPRYAVMVVKHPEFSGGGVKMDGQRQTSYPRKNWSSLMLINCGHPAVQSLSVRALNETSGLSLHQFLWASEDDIGALPFEWNVLVGVSADYPAPKAAHFTLGVPSMKGYEDQPFADEWRSYALR